jgi:hypothetical protein
VVPNQGRVALQRGPLVYALEAIDNGGSVLDLVMPVAGEVEAAFREDLLGGVVVLSGKARRSGAEARFTAIPYFAWANRGPGEMAVWMASR